MWHTYTLNCQKIREKNLSWGAGWRERKKGIIKSNQKYRKDDDAAPEKRKGSL